MYKELMKLRIDYGFTQEQMAKEAFKTSKTSYCKKERGKTKFTIDDIRNAKKFFNLSPDEVIKIFLI